MENLFKILTKRAGAFFLAALFFSAFASVFSASISWSSSPTVQSQINEIESRLLNEKKRLTHVNSRERDLLIELEDLEREVKEKKEAISALQEEIGKTEAEAGRLKIKLVEARVFEKEAESVVMQRLIAMYKYIKQGYVKALADVEEPWQFLRRVKYLKVVMAVDRDDLTEVMDLAIKRRREAKGIEKSLLEIEEVYRKEQIGLENLKISVKEKVFRLMTTHKEKEFHETSVRQLQNAAKGLKLTSLNIPKREVVDVSVPRSFGEMRGKLPFPSQGRIIDGNEFPEGTRQEQQKGVLIALPAAADVRAVFSGRVDFSGKLKGYGELIIISHGERFFTVSAHLSKRNRLEGDLVQKGDAVGVAGTDGISGGSRFYFEIRKGGRNLDPLEWFALK